MTCSRDSSPGGNTGLCVDRRHKKKLVDALQKWWRLDRGTKTLRQVSLNSVISGVGTGLFEMFDQTGSDKRGVKFTSSVLKNSSLMARRNMFFV